MMISRLTVFQKIFVLILVPFLFECVLVSMLYHMQQESVQLLEHERRSRTFIHQLEKVSLSTMEATRTTVLYGFTRGEDPKSVEKMESLRREIAADTPRLRPAAKLAGADTNKVNFVVKELEVAMDRLLEAQKAIDSRDLSVISLNSNFMRGDLYRTVPTLMNALADLNKAQMTKTHEIRQKQTALSKRITDWLIGGLIANLVVVFLMAFFIVRNITGRLNTITGNTKLFSQKELLNPTLEGTDEIAQLDRFFHKMVNDLRLAEAKEQAFVNQSADVIFSLDNQFLISKINETGIEQWGVNKSNELFIDLISAPDKARVQALLQDLAADNSKSNQAIGEKMQIALSDQSLRWVSCSFSWSAEYKMYFCVAHDIQKAMELEQLKKDFLHMMSHDVRTPLGAVAAYLEALISTTMYGPINEKGTRTGKVMIDSLQRVVTMINVMLDEEKLESGRVELDLETIDLAALARSATDSLALLAQEKLISVHTNLGQDYIVRGDRFRLHQVFQNIISNAIKYSPPEGVITVSVGKDGEHCIVKVQDQGPGINKTDSTKIFDKFTQLGASSAEKRSKGFGLGLYICKTIVEAHGGQIGVEQVNGSGSIFWFRIPRMS